MPGAQGAPGAMGPRGATGAAGVQGVPGQRGPKGEHGEAAHIDHVEAITGEPGTPAYAYNSGTDEHADLVFVIPAGATGPEGPMGPAGACCDACYGGLFNTDCGEFCTQPGEVAAMTFSGYFPAAGMHYDGNHSLVLESGGVYEIHYTLRAGSKSRSQLNMAVTNDGVVIPCSRVCKDVTGSSGIDFSCVALAEARAGAHLHLIAYGGDCGCECECFMLGEGVNLVLYAKKLGDLPDPPPDHDYERGRERGFERDFEHRFDRERERDFDRR